MTVVPPTWRDWTTYSGLADSAKEKEQWLRQLLDSLASAVQTGGDTEALTRLKKLEADTEFFSRLQSVYKHYLEYMAEKPREGMPTISYFSMEYGIHNSLKTFSGGQAITRSGAK